jgi:hypothetical protein
MCCSRRWHLHTQDKGAFFEDAVYIGLIHLSLPSPPSRVGYGQAAQVERPVYFASVPLWLMVVGVAYIFASAKTRLCSPTCTTTSPFDLFQALSLRSGPCSASASWRARVGAWGRGHWLFWHLRVACIGAAVWRFCRLLPPATWRPVKRAGLYPRCDCDWHSGRSQTCARQRQPLVSLVVIAVMLVIAPDLTAALGTDDSSSLIL